MAMAKAAAENDLLECALNAKKALAIADAEDCRREEGRRGEGEGDHLIGQAASGLVGEPDRDEG
eukprot:9967060-Heterocapsa_arctica.AAC.1